MSNWRDNLYVLKNKFDVCVIGPRGVGKSTLIYRFVHESLPNELELGKEKLYSKSISYNNSFRMVTIYDAAGEMDISEDHLFHAKSILLCYSLENNRSLLELEDMTERIQCRVNSDVIYAVVAIKKDGYRQVKTEIGEAFAESINAIGFYECNPLDDNLTDQVFESLIHAVIDMETDDAEKDYHIFPTQILPEHEFISRHRKLSIIPSGDEASTIDHKETAKSIQSLKGEQDQDLVSENTPIAPISRSTSERENVRHEITEVSSEVNEVLTKQIEAKDRETKNIKTNHFETDDLPYPKKASKPSQIPKNGNSNSKEIGISTSKQIMGSKRPPMDSERNHCCVIT